MIDPDLTTLAEKAAAGVSCPPVFLALSSGAIITGTPARGDVFDEDAIQAIRQEVWDAQFMVRNKRRPDNERKRLLAEATDDLRATARGMQDREIPDGVLVLAPARWLPPSGDGLAVPTMRVALDQVAAWWVGPTAEVIEAQRPKGGVAFGVGALFPVGD